MGLNDDGVKIQPNPPRNYSFMILKNEGPVDCVQRQKSYPGVDSNNDKVKLKKEMKKQQVLNISIILCLCIYYICSKCTARVLKIVYCMNFLNRPGPSSGECLLIRRKRNNLMKKKKSHC